MQEDFLSFTVIGGRYMRTMTEEEAFALDEYYTNNPPKVDPAKARIQVSMEKVTFDAEAYLAYESQKSSQNQKKI
jgi:hypothetical protein